MFKNTTTKIFLGFAALLLLEVGLLSYVFGRVVLRETETYILDALSRRSQADAESIARELGRKFSLPSFLSEMKITLITSNGEILGKTPPAISPNALKPLLPPSGSIVTECSDVTGEGYYCAFSFIPEIESWVFGWTPQSSLFLMMLKLGQEIMGLSSLLLGLSLAFAFFLSRFLMRPLRRFAQASSQVAQGHYENMKLPTDREDEVGEFAKAFQKMIVDLRDRERNIALGAMKLAHSERLASIGQMGASIAHEVKNPLTSMLGYARVLHQKTEDPNLKEAAEIILKESERCNQILQQMLRFARNDPAEKRPYAIHEVLQSTLLLIKSDAKDKHIHISSKIDTDAVVMGSAQQIQQVLLNLLMNALQASPPNTQIEIRSYDKDGKLFVDVEDHGTGIPQDLQSKVFEPFFTTKGKHEGTGLGLSVALQIMRDQGGDLHFESKPGKTIFQIELPMSLAS